MMNTIEGGVTAAKGFMAASAEAGFKYKNRTDMALVYTESPAARSPSIVAKFVMQTATSFSIRALAIQAAR